MGLFTLIAGPCIIEDFDITLAIAKHCKAVANELNLDYIFKASYKKANRTRIDGFVTIGEEKSLDILNTVRKEAGVKTITDVHETIDCDKVAKYVDYLQIPAFLCRQTDLLVAAGKTGKGINIKKGQFVSPESMEHAMNKVKSTGNNNVMITDRGTQFGYSNLIVDMTGIPKMKKFCKTVIMDCTHSVQLTNVAGGSTSGDASMIETITLASMAAGATGLFIETHPTPEVSKSDAANMLRMDKLKALLEKAIKVQKAIS